MSYSYCPFNDQKHPVNEGAC